MKKVISKIKGKKKDLTTLGDVVERVDWAEKEIKEAEDKLVELSQRIEDGVSELENAEKSSAAIVERHLEIQEKARTRKTEFQAKGQKVQDLINSIQQEVK
ncbi:hypothetical protein ACR6EC_12110 [Bacillus subtilis]|uniref:hypothetical protein n=1 Tax=Bacillus subtilis TaxID=1423 RepID=UPI000A117ECF|nr:hypothetical protein [Bacillus subtilis]MEC2266520.1 hypothetical protein [Bacillus subtilis]MEC4031916.1 hypothetical protein [Bacillus subtilis]MUG00738.1 hypothetical protein [Bacillus tequilensis]